MQIDPKMHSRDAAVRLIVSHAKINVKTIPEEFLFSPPMFACKQNNVIYLHLEFRD